MCFETIKNENLREKSKGDNLIDLRNIMMYNYT